MEESLKRFLYEALYQQKKFEEPLKKSLKESCSNSWNKCLISSRRNPGRNSSKDCNGGTYVGINGEITRKSIEDFSRDFHAEIPEIIFEVISSETHDTIPAEIAE